MNAAVTACEGLDKFLETLGAINQREVLIRHDRELIQEIVGDLEGIAPLMEISPTAATDLVCSAFSKAGSLEGYKRPLDELLEQWKHRSPQPESPQEMLKLGKRLRSHLG
jgi:hypothetical protein